MRGGPIYEPKDSQFRPYSIGTLLAFLVSRAIGRFFRRLRSAR
jgi:hypothetical protein